MKILKKYFYQAPLPFTQVVNGKKINHKQSALYFIESDAGIITTEIAPLSGFSSHRLQELCPIFEQGLKDQNYSSDNPHLAFSYYELNLKRQWSNPFSPESILSNDLFNYKQKEITPSTADSTIKIKIDDQLPHVLDFFKCHKQLLQNHPLRIDANRRLTPIMLKTIADCFEENSLILDYFEEPFSKLEDYKSCQSPYAFDESIKHYQDYNPTALVYKPTQHYTAEMLANTKCPAIISSTFDSPFTQATLIAIAHKNRSMVHGLNAVLDYSDLGLKLAITPSIKNIFPVLDWDIFKSII